MNEVHLPFSEDLEMALLSSVAKNPAIMDELAFRHDMFYIPANALIYQHLAETYTEHGEIDWHLFVASFPLAELSECGGMQGLNRVWECMPTASAYRYYYDQVKELYQKREGWRVCNDLMNNLLDKDFSPKDGSIQDAIEKGLSKIALDQPVPDIPLREDLQNSLDNIRKRKPGKGMLELSNIRALNLAVGCVLPGDEVVIGAETSYGKTSLAINFVNHLCFGEQKKRVAVFSMEMRKQSIHERIFAAMNDVPMEKIRRNELDEEQLQKLEGFIQSVPKEPVLFMDDSAVLDIHSIVSRCRRIKKRYGLDLVVVDYLQLVSPANIRSDNRQQAVADISRRLKMLAVELEVVVVALSQLNEQGQLRESRAIAQDADIVLLIKDGDSEDSFEKKIEINKNRNGPTGHPVRVHFFPQYVCFADKS